MLADRQEVGEVHRGVEGIFRMAGYVVAEHVDIGELHDPVHCIFEIGQV